MNNKRCISYIEKQEQQQQQQQQQQQLEKPVIEIAQAQDAPLIKTMIDAAYSKYIEPMGMIPAAMRIQYDELIRTQTATKKIYVLRLKNEIIGSITLGTIKDAITINNLVVNPSFHGRGFGRLLVNYAEDKALDWGLVAVQLYANEKMYDNLSFYLKLGFCLTGRRTEDGFHRVYFRKDLGLDGGGGGGGRVSG